MAFSASPHCAPPLHRFGLRRFPPPQPPLAFMRCPFFSSSSRPVYFSPAPTLRIIVSANSKKPYSGRSADSTSASAIDFLTLCHSLKTTKRKGWINHGIKGPESIADHMYRMALMALIAGDLPGVNRERCIKIAIVHDIAEAIVGDITPSCGVPKEEKSRREQAALTEMCKILGGGMRAAAEEIQELWLEYENNASLEANLVKDFDKVELILQALEYELEHGKVLNEFFLSTEGRVDYLKQDVISESIPFFSDVYSSTLPCGFSGKFQTEIGKSWAREINSRRNSILAEKRKGPK